MNFVAVLAYEYVCCFLFIGMFVCCCLPVLYVVVLAYEYVCCFLFISMFVFCCLPVNVFCCFCLPVNFAITERESHHVMVVSENETWIWRGRIVTMPLPSGF